MEEKGIRPDYITGTSMGAVIGALYSMGYSAEDLENIASQQDWGLLLSNDSPLYEIAPIEKRNHNRIPLNLYWKDDRFKFPAGLIRGQKLDISMSNLFIPAYNVNNFDELSIPFRCVAVDLIDGSVDVFNSGYLADAVRASMAIPSVFPPKEINGRLYVDGGLIRNFPVPELKEMGADILIGVYVGGIKMQLDNLVSMFDVLEQSAFMAGMLDSESQGEKLNVLVQPRVKRMGKFDFDAHKSFIQKGYEAAEEKDSLFNAIRDSLDAYGPSPAFKATSNPESISVDYITIKNSRRAVQKLVNSKFNLENLDSIHVADIERSLALIYGTKNFSKTYYSFSTQEGKTGLEIYTRNVDPYTLGISLNRFKRYNSAIILNAEARNVLGNLSNFRMDVRLSENPGLQAQYYWRFPNAPSYLVRFYGKLEGYELPFVNDDVTDRLYRYRESDLKAELVKEWRNAYLFSAGYHYHFDRIKPIVFKNNDISRYRSVRHSVFMNFELNSTDRQVYAREGLHVNLRPVYVFSNNTRRSVNTEGSDFLEIPESDKYFQLHLNLESYYSLNSSLCLEGGIRGRVSNALPFLDNYKVGGPIQSKDFLFGFIGLEESEFLIGDFISARLGTRFQYKQLFYFTPLVQYLYGEDLLHYAFDRNKNTSLLGFGVQIGMDTPIGPVSFDLGYTNLTDELNLNLGIGFRHIY